MLLTDLEWPAYAHVIRDTAAARDKSICIIGLKNDLFSGRLTGQDLVQLLVDAYDRQECNGIFLSDISYLGIGLPIVEVLRQLKERCQFSVIDGAQALNHRPVDLSDIQCDLYLAGTQKWFCSYHPLRIAFVAHRRSGELFESATYRMRHTRDALFDFCHSLQHQTLPSFGETVNVVALMAAAGALNHIRQWPVPSGISWYQLRQNSAALTQWFSNNKWRPMLRESSLQTGIVPLKHYKANACSDTRQIRRTLAECGLTASVFPDGLLRFSMPRFRLTLSQMSVISRALHKLGT